MSDHQDQRPTHMFYVSHDAVGPVLVILWEARCAFTAQYAAVGTLWQVGVFEDGLAAIRAAYSEVSKVGIFHERHG